MFEISSVRALESSAPASLRRRPNRYVDHSIKWNSSLSELLSSGGDERLTVDPVTAANVYGCTPFPNQMSIECASSTATSISVRSFAHAEGKWLQLNEESSVCEIEDVFDSYNENIRQSLCRLFALEWLNPQIVLSPSGTDSALHSAYVANVLLGSETVSIIVGADETGRGLPLAASFRHFGSHSALGFKVDKGRPLGGLDCLPDQVAINFRDETGSPRGCDAIDAAVINAVRAIAAAGQRAIIYAMDCSKTGLSGPSFACLDYIADRWPHSALIVVDACQARLSLHRLHTYLEHNFLVLLTGSKFFTGPPFSGVLFIPDRYASALAEVRRVPAGLRQYTARWSWPLSWRSIRGALSPQMNFGEWLRWEAALEEMRAYFKTPVDFRLFAFDAFENRIRKKLLSDRILRDACVRDTYPGVKTGRDTQSKTILPFFLCPQGQPLSYANCTEIYRRLNSGYNQTMPHNLVGHGSLRLGQPVAIADDHGGQSGVLRVSLSARMISESWIPDETEKSKANLDRSIAEIEIALDCVARSVVDFVQA